jgi:hypothetical protein
MPRCQAAVASLGRRSQGSRRVAEAVILRMSICLRRDEAGRSQQKALGILETEGVIFRVIRMKMECTRTILYAGMGKRLCDKDKSGCARQLRLEAAKKGFRLSAEMAGRLCAVSLKIIARIESPSG